MATQPTSSAGANISDASLASERDLQFARRLDWRFLLSDPAPLRVGYSGTDHVLRNALRRSTTSLLEFDSDTPMHPAQAGQSSLDLFVLSNPSKKELLRAANWTSTRGELYVELDRRRRLQSIASVENQLRELGLRSVRRIWNRPRFEGCRELMPLSENLPMRYLLARSRGDGVAHRKARMAQFMHSSGLLPRVAPCVSLIARRHDEAHRELPRWIAEQFTRSGVHIGTDAGDVSFLLVCPQFPTSRHVVLLVFERGSDSPALAVKVARLPGDNAALCDEYETLTRVHALRAGGFESIPKARAFASIGDRAVLVGTGIAGEMLRPRTVGKHWRRCSRLGLDWLCEFNTASRDVAETLHSLRDCAEDTAARLLNTLVPNGEEQAVIAECVLMVGSVTATVPRVWQHADLGHPNLLLAASQGELGVIDWELATARGLPACDLFFFLTYVAFARTLATTNDESVRAFRDAFFVPGAWARPFVREYAARMGLSREVLTPLFLLCWMEYLAARAARIRNEGEDAAAISWLRQDRYYHLWRYAADHANQLDWAS